MINSRRKFLKNTFSVFSTTFLAPNLFAKNIDKSNLDIGLQMYSFAPLIMQGKFDLLGFPDLVKNTYGINGAEYWSIPFMGRENDKDFLNDLKRRSDDIGVDNLIILVDDIDIKTMQSGPSLASSNKNDRDTAIDYHKKWVDVAKNIGCHSIRINLRSEEENDQKILENSSESISRLIEFSKQDNISIVIENHGGITGDADWLVSLMKNVDSKHLGTLPDFGTYNFCIKRGNLNFQSLSENCEDQYNKYLGVKKLMPYAKGVSAKSHEFDKDGEELSTNYSRMIKIISESNYKGYITIEYEGAMKGMFGGEGTYLNPHEGILATKKLINKYL
ncbi:MAG: TIM barrel protein, partial [Bacteroidota bacterium]|nr:TIM barrel protein [Bacteroidota bacterium]